MTHLCPLCGKKESLVCDDCVCENGICGDGIFYSCHEEQGGCGTTFRVTPAGECVDIF